MHVGEGLHPETPNPNHKPLSPNPWRVHLGKFPKLGPSSFAGRLRFRIALSLRLHPRYRVSGLGLRGPPYTLDSRPYEAMDARKQ